MTRLPARFLTSLCGTGLWLGTLFFAASLTPSLIPRDAALQGVLSGIAFALGYSIGAVLRATWRFLHLPEWVGLWTKMAAAVTCMAVAAMFLWQASEWQNSVRVPMGLDRVESARPIVVGGVAGGVALVVTLLVHLFKSMARGIAHLMDRIAPRRVSVLVGILAAFVLFWAIGNGILLRTGIRALDSSYRALDARTEDGIERPTDPRKTGSAGSLIRWDDLGRMGRSAVSSGPTRTEIAALTGQPAMEPLRVYVGLNSADAIDARASLALAEMIRVGAFERSALVVTTPTGTGWLDPASQMPLEFLLHGDVATVAVQYSYLPSWLALMVEPSYGADTARALFRKVYDHWHALPKASRPRLYLHGLSLGALNSDLSVDLLDVIGDPFDGALWSGPPFQSRTWGQATRERLPGSPAWLPRLRAGSVIRFAGPRATAAPTTDTNVDATAARDPGTDWGPMRIVYLQYASDPITFFETRSAVRAPDWMTAPRGPDVSPELRWYPIITFLQLGLDMAIATTTPMGHGHVYAPSDYVDAWAAVTRPQGWTPASYARLKRHLTARLDEDDAQHGDRSPS